MVTKRNRREARQYAFKCYMPMNFILIKMMFNFPRGNIHKAMDKAYANGIIEGVLSNTVGSN